MSVSISLMGDEEAVDFTRTFASASATPATPPTLGQSMSRSLSKTSASSQELEGRFPPGTLLNGRYRIIALLGRGGMGEVYRATDLTLGQSVALKFLLGAESADEHWIERFHNEVRVARQVSHPNVCRVYDIGETEGLAFLSMEYVDGEDLSTLLKRIGRLPNDKALEISRKICAGLAAAHAKGVIHRDLKPANVMLDRRGEVLICDFGLAAIASELGAGEAKQGTPAYMAPEQLKGTGVSERSDIYSLGLVLYELFTGKRAYNAGNIHALLNQQEAMDLTAMHSIASEIDPAVEKTIRRCLNPDPEKRPASALQVSAALPGGDPLAAALAAGETPSPEMVAAGESRGLEKKISIPLLVFVAIGMLLPVLMAPLSIVDVAPMPYPPEALLVKTQELVAKLGYPDKPAQYKVWMDEAEGLRSFLQRQNKASELRRLFDELSPVEFLLRQSPKLMTDALDGKIRWKVPAFDEPGMVRVKVDSRGRLREFDAVPLAEPRGNLPAPATMQQITEWMGLDASNIIEMEPQRVPPVASDERKAWRVPLPQGFPGEVVIECAYWKARPTSIRARWPWTPPPKKDQIKTPLAKAQTYLGLTLLAALLIFGSTLARKNWKSGRADRKGALRVALFVIGLEMVEWALRHDFTPDLSQVAFFLEGLSNSLLMGLIFWLLYLALEPALRSKWPQSIVTWNRMLAGNWNDRQVASHLLVGAGMGVLILLPLMASSWYEFTQGQRLTGVAFDFFLSPRLWGASHLTILEGALQSGMVMFFLLFGLRSLLRREWLAIIAAAILLTVLRGSALTALHPALDLGIHFGIYVTILLVIVRFGLLTTVFGVFFINCLGRCAYSTDFNSWVNGYSTMTTLLLAGFVLWAFRRSLENHEILEANG